LRRRQFNFTDALFTGSWGFAVALLTGCLTSSTHFFLPEFRQFLFADAFSRIRKPRFHFLFMILLLFSHSLNIESLIRCHSSFRAASNVSASLLSLAYIFLCFFASNV